MRLLVLLTFVLAGCATSEPHDTPPTIERVEVPVRVACLPAQMPERPAIQSAEALRALPEGQFVIAIAVERKELIVYSDQLEAVIKGCE